MRKQIWILDDDKDFCLFLKKIIEQNFDYNVKWFTSEREFEDIIFHENDIPSLILMDVRLNKENGLRFGNKIHEKLPNIPIIHLTALDGDDIRSEKYTILSKPVNKPLLLKTVSNFLVDY